MKQDHIPVTNVTRHYDYTITRGKAAPDGVEREVSLVNNHFPEPAIEANWRDMIEITIRNNKSYPLEGTALHWHGFLQRGSNWMDQAKKLNRRAGIGILQLTNVVHQTNAGHERRCRKICSKRKGLHCLLHKAKEQMRSLPSKEMAHSLEAKVLDVIIAFS